MLRPARLAAAKEIEFLRCSRPFSNFAFLESRFSFAIRPLRRILSQARMHAAQTLVVEKLDYSTTVELTEEVEDIQKYSPGSGPIDPEVFRISFFRDPVTADSIRDASNDSFIGYAIYVEDTVKARVFESVIRSIRRENNYVHREPVWKCRIGGVPFKVPGYIYAQQNEISNTCAHVAVRTVASSYLKRDLSYREIHDIVTKYRARKKLGLLPPSAGLDNNEICHILHKIGATTFVGDYEGDLAAPIPYQMFLYGSIESGFPAIIYFGGEKNARGDRKYHAIPIFGHTFNQDTWVPEADIRYFPLRKATSCLSSGTWVSMFIGHDDNVGSNYCIPQHYLEPHRICRDSNGSPVLKAGQKFDCPQQGGCVSYAIGTLPSNIKMNPIEAETIGADYLLAILKEAPTTFSGWQERWQSRLAQNLEGKPEITPTEDLILRTTLVTGSEYREHLSKITGWDPSRKIPDWMLKALRSSPIKKTYFWMVEVSLRELFSVNRRKVGEILISADRKPSAKLPESFFLARLPGCIVFLVAAKQKGKPDFVYLPIPIDDHVELIGCED